MIKQEVKLLIEEILEETTGIEPIGHHHLKRHMVFKVKLQKETVVIKLYFKPNKWNREVSALRILNELEIQVPKVLKYGVHNDIEYLVMNYIDAEVLSESKISNLNDIYYDAGKQLGEIHKKCHYNSYGILEHDLRFKVEFDNWKDYFLYEANRHIGNLIRFKHPYPKLIEEGKKLYHELCLSMNNDSKAVLTHNDLSSRNIFVKDNVFLSLFDFEQSCIQNPYRELVFIEYHLGKEDSSYFTSFIDGYKNHMEFDINQFNENKDLYLVHYGLAICSWSYEVDRDHYQEGINILRRYIKDE